MERIESKESLVKWGNQVNMATTKQICDLQDDFAYSEMKEVKSYFANMSQNEKELVIFSISKAMGSATLFEFVKGIAQNLSHKFIEEEGEEINNRWNELLKAESSFRSEKEQLQATIELLKTQNEELTRDSTLTNKQCSDYVKRIWELESNIEQNEKAIDEMRAFESHIKGLLQPN